MRLRGGAFALVLLVGILWHPSGASGQPREVLVSADYQGNIVRVVLEGDAVTHRQLLRRGSSHAVLIPSSWSGRLVEVTRYDDQGSHLMVLDLRTGTISELPGAGQATNAILTRGGQQMAYEAAEQGDGVAVVESDPYGRHPRVIAAKGSTGNQRDILSGMAVTRSGATAYVGATRIDTLSVLESIDTQSGLAQPIVQAAPWTKILDVVLSPKEDLLAVTYLDEVSFAYRVALIPVGGGAPTLVTFPTSSGDDLASSFTTDGKKLILSPTMMGAASTLRTYDIASGKTRVVASSGGLGYTIAARA